MFDFRYHIISLVAVFLALGIGILVGTMVMEKGVISKQEKAIIERLEEEFGKLREENQALKRETEINERFQRSIQLSLLKGRLTGKNIAIIITTNLSNSLQKDLIAVLEQAGAKVSSTTTLLPPLWTEKKRNVDRGKILTELAKQIVTGENPKTLQDFKKKGFLKLHGSYRQPVSAVIIIGGQAEGKENLAEKLDIPLIKELLTFNIRVVGGETRSSEVSYMPAYQRLGISTVDNLDSPIGQISLVFVLEGQDGNYGVKSTAQQLLPPLRIP